MAPVIRVSGTLFSRLECHAEGFDTPAAVIERILNVYEGVDASSEQSSEPEMLKRPELIFHPADEKEILRKLVEKKSAWVNVHHNDGSIKTSPWYADKMQPTSNLRANIWSGRLRDWKKKGIVKAEFYFDPKDLQK
jgi:hypothetical protein